MRRTCFRSRHVHGYLQNSNSLPNDVIIAFHCKDIPPPLIQLYTCPKLRTRHIPAAFVASFIDDSFAPGGEKLLEPAAELVGELICDPVTERGRFVSAYFDTEKTNLIDAIRSQINDKRDYAAARLLQEMCAGEPYGVSRLGDERTAEKLQMKKLYAQYGELISTARLELIYIGSAQLDRVRQALDTAFSTLPRDGIRDIAPSAPHPARRCV